MTIDETSRDAEIRKLEERAFAYVARYACSEQRLRRYLERAIRRGGLVPPEQAAPISGRSSTSFASSARLTTVLSRTPGRSRLRGAGRASPALLRDWLLTASTVRALPHRLMISTRSRRPSASCSAGGSAHTA
ncbi:hypothetical protein [Hankyongella ginsenosidimutans]|uniref:hypothetical protein n=1 Tax=Hankyongella ginsenosidimutans TaxID=1763828 RepID=UPI003CCC6DD8